MEETKWLKPSISVSRIGDSASVQAATRVNAEQALYGLCQGGVSTGRRIFFPWSVSLFDLRARFFVPTRASLALARAETVKVGRRTNPFRQAPPLPGHTLTASSTTARLVRSG
jgi:hypothetical protein